MRKFFLYVSSFLSLFAILVTIAVVFMGTTSGSLWLLNKFANHIPGKITVKQSSGSFLSDFHLGNVDYQGANWQIKIQQLKIRCEPWNFFQGAIHISDFQINEAEFLIQDINGLLSADPSNMKEYFRFPIPIFADNVLFKRVKIVGSGFTQIFKNVTAAGYIDSSRFQAKKLRVQNGKKLDFIEGDINFRYDGPFQLGLNWMTDTHLELIKKWRLIIDGNITKSVFTLKVEKPLVASAIGHFLIAHNTLKLSNNTSLNDSRPSIQINNQNKNDDLLVDFPSVIFDQFQVNLLGGSAELSGNIALTPELSSSLIITGKEINPGLLWPDSPGKLTATALIESKIVKKTPVYILKDLKMGGILLDQKIKAQGTATLNGAELQSCNFNIEVANNKIALTQNASTDPNPTIHFDFMVQNPTTLWPPLQGTFSGNGLIKNILSQPSVNVNIEGINVKYGKGMFQNLNGMLSFEIGHEKPFNAKISAKNILLNNKKLSNASFNLSGDFKDHFVIAKLEDSSLEMDIVLSGKFDQDRWQITFNEFSTALNDSRHWVLNAPVSFLVEHNRIKSFEACWHTNETTQNLCVRGALDKNLGWSTSGEIDAPPFRFIENLVQQVIEIKIGTQKIYKQ